MSDDDADDNLDVNAAGNENNSGNNNERLLTVAEDLSDTRNSANMEFEVKSSSQLIASRHRSKTLPPEEPK